MTCPTLQRHALLTRGCVNPTKAGTRGWEHALGSRPPGGYLAIYADGALRDGTQIGTRRFSTAQDYEGQPTTPGA